MTDHTDLQDDLDAFLVGRTYLYKCFWAIFGKEPTQELADFVCSDTAKQSFDLFEGSYASKTCQLAQTLFDNSQDQLQGDNLERLKWDYTRLFIGCGKPLAPPWESVYANSEGLIKQRCMLEVRDEYAKQGFAPRNRPTALDDSLSLEVDFMFRMADKIRQADASEERATLVECSSQFLENHLCTWVGRFADRIEAAECEFYTTAAFVLTAFIDYDRMFLTDSRFWG